MDKQNQNWTIQQFELFHDTSQAWTAKINDQQVPCVGLALVDGQVQGLISPTQLKAGSSLDGMQGWVPANGIAGFQGYYQPGGVNANASGSSMREPVGAGAGARTT